MNFDENKVSRIAHLAGPAATIQNSPPLVTSIKAREKYGTKPLPVTASGVPRVDVLRAQRLAAPVTVFVEQFSAHPLESDAANLYGPPDGYLDTAGTFIKERKNSGDTPVYEIELRPEDGLYPLPYMARQADGSNWDEECAFPGAPRELARQAFYPDGSRIFEEIDRLEIGADGLGNQVSSKAHIEFHRVLPSGGYVNGRAGADRSDAGVGDIPPERLGVDFFAYRPYHLLAVAPRPALARIANGVQAILSRENAYDGAIWHEASPSVEETIYWLNLIVDTGVPICANSAQRTHQQISADGSRNIVDTVEYISSQVWADAEGMDRVGAVFIADQRIFAARAVMKADARPGGYIATGGHGGVLGSAGNGGPPLLLYYPSSKHTHSSDVNLTRLPSETAGVTLSEGRIRTVPVAVKDRAGNLLESAIPKVVIIKDGSYESDGYGDEPDSEVDINARLERMLSHDPLAGFVVEGLSPYGIMTSTSRNRVALRAIYSGIPVVRVGRGNTEGFVRSTKPYVGGSNLTSTKARILLIAALLKLGSLPPAADPNAPTPQEITATNIAVNAYQALFNTH